MPGGPVLYMELLLGSRRNRQYIFRWIYGGWLVCQFSFLFFLYWIEQASTARGWWIGFADPDATFNFAHDYVTLFLWQQLILLMIATPAMAAGAISDEKESGTLQYLLSAGLTSSEIVLGKLLGRMVMIGNVFVVGVPFILFAANFAGLGLGVLLALLIQTVATVFALAAGSLLASVWARQTRDAVIQLYAVTGLLVLVLLVLNSIASAAAPPPGAAAPWWFPIISGLGNLLDYYDPLYVLAPAWRGDGASNLGGRLLVNVAAWLTVGCICLLVATLRMRPAYNKQLEGAGKRTQRLLQYARPECTSEPLTWKERHVVGVAPFRWIRFIPRTAAMVGIFVITSLAVVIMIQASATGAGRRGSSVWDIDLGLIHPLFGIDPTEVRSYLMMACFIGLLLATLVVGIRCSGAITGEREKNTWEALLLTPLDTHQLVRAKLWGVIGATYPYLAVYAIPLFLFSILGGPGGVAIFLIALPVTWLAMFYVGAAGLWCSARSKGSWRSLLGVLGWAYLGGALAALILSPILWIVWMVMMVALMILEWAIMGNNPSGPAFSFASFFVAAAALLAGACLLGSWFFLKEAEKRIADYDRARHWSRERKRRPKVKPRQISEFEEAEKQAKGAV